MAPVANGFVDMLLTPQVQALPGYAAWLRFEEIGHTLGDCAMLAHTGCGAVKAACDVVTRNARARQPVMPVDSGLAGQRTQGVGLAGARDRCNITGRPFADAT